MPEDKSNMSTDDRRSNTRELVEKLLAERSEMLVLYYRAAGLDSESHSEPLDKAVQSFCQLLVDYIAAGHFTLYDRIVQREERRQPLAAVAEKIYPEIAATTSAALDFNDKYENSEKVRSSSQLTDDLSELGELLATRIELEDKLLQLLR